MAHWLVKADPDSYGLPQLERDRRTVWDGVSNAVAVKHLRNVKKGDGVLVYHTGDEKSIVGLATAASNSRDDAKNPKLAVFDLAFAKRFAFPVPLGAIKADPQFADFELVRIPRLSVMPVPATLWKQILRMAGEG